MLAITNPEQLGFAGQDIRLVFKDGHELTGHATMHASDDLIDLRVADGKSCQFSLHDRNLRSVTCLHDIDEQ
jgi:hypothetical protein